MKSRLKSGPGGETSEIAAVAVAVGEVWPLIPILRLPVAVVAAAGLQQLTPNLLLPVVVVIATGLMAIVHAEVVTAAGSLIPAGDVIAVAAVIVPNLIRVMTTKLTIVAE